MQGKGRASLLICASNSENITLCQVLTAWPEATSLFLKNNRDILSALSLMRRTNNQFAPHQQRARNAGQRHEQQNTNKNSITGIADRARAVRGAGRPCKPANANHGEPDNGLGCACENPRCRRVDRRADADQISSEKPLGAIQY